MMSDERALQARRTALMAGANPRTDVDYVIGLTRSLDAVAVAGDASPVDLHLRYVPDREILVETVWPDYAERLASASWPDLESLATVVFDDLINQLVPRWLCLTATAQDHYVVLQDRQPAWSNPDLLAALEQNPLIIR